MLKVTADADDLDHLLSTGALRPHLGLAAGPTPGLRAGAPNLSAAPVENPSTPAPSFSMARLAAVENPTEAPSFGPPTSAAIPDLSAPVPDLEAPTKQESITAGKREFQAGMPQVDPNADPAAFYRAKRAQAEYKQEHPWGSPISAEPGFFGKVGHALAEGGNIAGDILAPGATSLIPGSQLNLENEEEKNLAGEEKTAQLASEQENAATAGKNADTEAQREKFAEDQARNTIPVTLPDGRTFNLPAKTAEDYFKAQQADQTKSDVAANKRFTDPFQAFAYGTPMEKKAARDFLTFEKQADAKNQRPDDIDARYALYKRDPQAYTAMFGSKDAAQDSRNQAQAARMLKYFDGQRNSIQKDFMLTDAERQAQLNEIDQLEQPYLDIAQPQQNGDGSTPRTGGRGNGNAGNAEHYNVGDEVTYKGQHMRVSRVRKDGKLELQPIAGGAQ